MSDYVPFIGTQQTLKLVRQIYGDARIARVSLELAEKITLPPSLRVWIDAGVDGFDDLETRRSRPGRNNSWYELMTSISGFDEIADRSFLARPRVETARTFVKALLDRCVKHKPAWITVPQLPAVSDSARNKFNRVLAEVTGEWKSSSGFSGRLILPLIFTNQNQINGKTQRNPKVTQARRCYYDARADGFWVVDASLTDDSGSKTLRNTRLPAIIALHQELNAEISSKIKIGGPYWGTNLVLWARGLVDHPAIGVGSSYKYHITGGQANPPAARIAISALRRRVIAAEINSWLDKALKRIGPSHSATRELDGIQKRLALLSDPETAREQVARFYKQWLDLLGVLPPAGRSLALFQDLSTAYAFGRSLPELGKNEGTARRPESVVEPLMLNCI